MENISTQSMDLTNMRIKETGIMVSEWCSLMRMSSEWAADMCCVKE